MTEFASTAYILVSHGSRDPRHGKAMERLAQVVLMQIQEQRLTVEIQSPAVKTALSQCLRQERTQSVQNSPSPGESVPLKRHQKTAHTSKSSFVPAVPLVGTACLELSSVPLHQQIIDFSRRAAATGVKTVRVVPLFLLRGVHVMEDIPDEIRQAQAALPHLAIEICPHLGSHPGMKRVLKGKQQVAKPGALLLLAHGSRRAGGNNPIYTLAEALDGTAAFWAVTPSIEDQVIQLIQTGIQRLTILPYFLFAGSVTDAITHATEDLAERFPQVTFHLLPPLGPTEKLASLVADLALDRVKLNTQKSSIPLRRTAFRCQLSSFMVS